MQEGTPNPQINVSKIPGGGGVAGAMVAISSTLIFLIRIRLSLVPSRRDCFGLWSRPGDPLHPA